MHRDGRFSQRWSHIVDYCIALLHEQKLTLQVPYSFNEFKNEGVRLHTHLKGLIMVPYIFLYIKHSPL